MAELPPEVLERLSTHGRVRLSVGDDAATSADVYVAPLNKQLFLLLTKGGASEQRLLEEPRATILAEDRASEWVIRSTGRAVPGRPIPAESRRPELMHWLPEGVPPSELVAVRFHPETVEYVQGKGAARTRAAGEVPGGALPPALTRWTMLATDGVVLWFFGMAALDWLGLFFLVEDAERRRMLLLLLLVAVGGCLLGGVTLVHQAARYARWREGLESDEGARYVLDGWEAPGRLRVAGLGMIGLGAVLAVLVSAGAGWRVGVWAVLASGAPLVGAFHTARHLLRRKDAEGEFG